MKQLYKIGMVCSLWVYVVANKNPRKIPQLRLSQMGSTGSLSSARSCPTSPLERCHRDLVISFMAMRQERRDSVHKLSECIEVASEGESDSASIL